MRAEARSFAVYGGLIVSLLLCRILLSTVGLDFKTDAQRTIFQWWALAAIAVYGSIGVYLSSRTGFLEMWNSKFARGRGPAIAVLHGAVIGLSTIALDVLKPIASGHHPLPESLAFYWYGAVVSEIWFHLVPVPLFIFVFSNLLMGGRHQESVFWIALLFLSSWESRRFYTDPEMWTVVETAGHIVTYLANASEIWLFRRYGFLAAVTQRVASYSLWHIAWPALQA